MPLAGRVPAARRRRRLAALACACALAMSACSGEDPEPIVSDSPSGSASPSESPSEATKQPWQKRSKAGAVAFVKHWVDVFNEAGANRGHQRTARSRG